MERLTGRKRILFNVLSRESECATLWEELCWKVFRRERSSWNLAEIPRSYRSSLARTIRDCRPTLTITKLHRPDELPAGIVVRAALYRLETWSRILEFRRSPDSCAFCRYIREISFDSPRMYWQVRCELFLESPRSYAYSYVWEGEPWPTAKTFPVTLPLTVVSLAPLETSTLDRMSQVRWPIYRLLKGKMRRLASHHSVRRLWPEDVGRWHAVPMNTAIVGPASDG